MGGITAERRSVNVKAVLATAEAQAAVQTRYTTDGRPPLQRLPKSASGQSILIVRFRRGMNG
jgi:hypothetical protein